MEQKTRGRYVVGLLLLVILTASVYLVFQDEGVKIDIQRTRTFYYIDVDGSWQLAGIEYVNLFDGAAKMRASSRSLETFVDGDLIKVVRIANYKENISTIETYLFDGSLKAVETFPLQHEIRVLNGEGKILQYEITDLNYSGQTVWNVESPQEFGWNMKAEWDLGYYYSRIWRYANIEEGKLTVRYRPNSTDYTINARFFDPEQLPHSAEELKINIISPENISYNTSKVWLILNSTGFDETTWLYFGGVADYVEFPEDNILNLSNDFTISFWVNTTSTSLGRIIYKRIDSNNAYQVAMTSDGTISVGTVIGGTTYRNSSTTSINNGTWRHVTTTIDSLNNIKIFIDGTEEATYKSTTIARAGTVNELFIGKRADNSSFFQGGLDDFRFYDFVLSPEEVNYLTVRDRR
jgi:hypothetical protein